jgi:hypothetical protein
MNVNLIIQKKSYLIILKIYKTHDTNIYKNITHKI